MSATVIDEKLQTKLPAEICAAAGVSARDQVEWRVEDGEIRGRKLPPGPRRVTARLVARGGALVFQAEGVTIDPEGIGQAVTDERESR